MALKASGAIQAARWTDLGNDEGFIYSFNGPHSLFADTIRSLRSLAIAHRLGHVLVGEKDRKISLLHRLIRHAETTARYNVYFGQGRDIYDVRGRVAHESIFNVNDGSYRCPNTQQGYSPFSTWTRGLAWILCGFAEQLEYFLASPLESELQPYGGKAQVVRFFEEVGVAVADFYISSSPTDGIPYWDTGAPGLSKLGDYLGRAADPYNEFEPVDSSAAAIAAQGLLRLGFHLNSRDERSGDRYFGAGLKIAQTLFDQPYLSISPEHEGLLLHSVYHRPNGWDHIPPEKKVPQGEASMWGDYHARELALFLLRLVNGQPYYRFFTPSA
jgi:unsaturated chondroitin disaccharide hydrolase